MKDSSSESGPVTVEVTWRIRQGYVKEFEEWRKEISAAALEFPGHMGIRVIHPGDQESEYVVVFRFDTYDHTRSWLDSDIRRKLLDKAAAFKESEPSYNVKNGLEYWFAPSGTAISPPRWKMAIVTVLGVWPVSMLVPQLLLPLVTDIPSVLQTLLVAIGIVIILTWVVMPILVKVLNPWLHHRS